MPVHDEVKKYRKPLNEYKVGDSVYYYNRYEFWISGFVVISVDVKSVDNVEYTTVVIRPASEKDYDATSYCSRSNLEKIYVVNRDDLILASDHASPGV
jgi:hypothetical protein